MRLHTRRPYRPKSRWCNKKHEQIHPSVHAASPAACSRHRFTAFPGPGLLYRSLRTSWEQCRMLRLLCDDLRY